MSIEEQYRTDANLNARIDLHARFATDPSWGRWLFDYELGDVPRHARILEIGCGPASTLWGANLDRIDPSWRLTLADFSPGMIESARGVLGERAEYVVANAQKLPFEDESFDVVLANHMLYHVAERSQTFAEIRRVLVAGGAFHAATNGRGHLGELYTLVGPDLGVPPAHRRVRARDWAAPARALLRERQGRAIRYPTGGHGGRRCSPTSAPARPSTAAISNTSQRRSTKRPVAATVPELRRICDPAVRR